ncbi:MAG: ATP-binding protein [Candidatus Eremiobacteraeota bacterium]|nr:ATP-binding protein [Candidatus Eremiobacteraeota bacterium]
MIKQIEFENWKSFSQSTLYVDPLTVLIGTNSSGKSNALDGFQFLLRITQGKEIKASLAGETLLTPIRGGVEWASLRPHNRFTVKAMIGGDTEQTDYSYTITVETHPEVQLAAESLTRIKYRPRTKTTPYELTLFKTDPVRHEGPAIIARLYNEKRGAPREVSRQRAVINQIGAYPLRKEITEGIKAVSQALQNIFILDPIPFNMRNYSPLSETLQSDASNIAGVLAALTDSEKNRIEATLTDYARHLPERDIRRVWSEKVGRFESDAMLYCEEEWVSNKETVTIDARGMSDGTLRFLAIVTALLTRPKGSQLIIEEIDNGLHPSRSDILLKMLREIGAERSIDVLVTTHNPALLDALSPAMMPYVLIAHRDPKSGFSMLTPLEDISDLPKLFARGSLGKLIADGSLEKSLTREAAR